MSLFGTNASGLGPPTGSLFGQPTNNTNNTNTTGPSTLFGTNIPQNQNTFNQTNQNAFNQTNQNAFNQTMNQQQQQQQQQQAASLMNASLVGRPANSIWEVGRDAPQTQKPITEQCGAIFEKWNPLSPNTSFKSYFYNKVEPYQMPHYQPAPNEDQREWEEAMRNKPGPGFVPVLVTGFAGIAERLKNQRNALVQYNGAMHQINANLDEIMSRHELQWSVRALNARRRHIILRQRCLALATRVQVLRNRGYQMDTDEDELKTKLETLERDMCDPALSARTEELWSRLILLRGHADTLRKEINARGNDLSDGIPEEAEAKAKKILEDYDKQLQALKTAVEKIKEDYEEWEKEHPDPTKTPAKK